MHKSFEKELLYRGSKFELNLQAQLPSLSLFKLNYFQICALIEMLKKTKQVHTLELTA